MTIRSLYIGQDWLLTMQDVRYEPQSWLRAVSSCHVLASGHVVL